MVRDLVRPAPEREPLDAGQPSAADYGEICLLLVRHVDDGFGRVAPADMALHLDALVQRVARGARESRVRDVAQIDRFRCARRLSSAV